MRFDRWQHAGRRSLTITFAARRGGAEIYFDEAIYRKSCGFLFGEPKRVFVFHGVRVNWSGTFEDQAAWRCSATRLGSLYVRASQSLPGADDPASPLARRLAKVVASATRAHS